METHRKSIAAKFRGILLLALVLLISHPAGLFAQEAQGAMTQGFDLGNGPLTVTSDDLVMFHEENRAEFSGNVLAIQGKTRLKADKVTVWFKKARQKAPEGQAASQSLEKVKAEGRVNIQTDQFSAKSDAAVYETATEILVLSGREATLTKGENIVKGVRIVVDQKKGSTKVEAGKAAQVTVKIFPESEPVKKQEKK